MRPKSTTLTAHELELMKIIWRSPDGVTVRDVYEALRKKRPIAYTSVMTTMKTLEEKGYLKASQQDRAHLYKPAQPKAKVVRALVRDFVDRVFNGAGQPLVLHLLEDEQITEDELREITRMTGKKR